MSSISGSAKYDGGPGSSIILSDFDTEYVCNDHAMVRQVVRTAVQNYFSAPCTNPSHMTICIDFTEGAPIPSNSTSNVRYQSPLVQINVERKVDSRKSNVTTTAAKDDDKMSVSLTSEKDSESSANKCEK